MKLLFYFCKDTFLGVSMFDDFKIGPVVVQYSMLLYFEKFPKPACELRFCRFYKTS